MSNRTLRYTSLVAALLLLLCVALTAQDVSVAPANAVVQGTIVLIQLTDRLDTRTVKALDHFHARLAESLTAPNGMTVATGSKIKGHISAVEPGLHTRILLEL